DRPQTHPQHVAVALRQVERARPDDVGPGFESEIEAYLQQRSLRTLAAGRWPGRRRGDVGGTVGDMENGGSSRLVVDLGQHHGPAGKAEPAAHVALGAVAVLNRYPPGFEMAV